MLTQHGLRITGQTPDGVYVEICELADHPWYLGCQFHPEFKSKPLEPHPLFAAFIGAALSISGKQQRATSPRQRSADPRQHAWTPIASPFGSRVSFGNGAPLALIAGPCVIESEEHVHFLAREIRESPAPFVFKASFDKANRSSVTSYRGPGLKEGLRILAGLRDAGHSRAHRHSRTRASRTSPPKRWTFCRSRRSCAARPICWSQPGAPAAP